MSLIEAAEHGHVDEVRTLLAMHPYPYADEDRYTALMRASAMGHTAIVRALLDVQAEV